MGSLEKKKFQSTRNFLEDLFLGKSRMDKPVNVKKLGIKSELPSPTSTEELPVETNLKRSKSLEPDEKQQNKKRRKRNADDRRTKSKRRNWSQDEVNIVLDLCIDLHNNGQLFEKPSARVYYEKIHQSLQFQNCDRQSVNNKMRHIKTTYSEALKFKKEAREKEDYDRKKCKKNVLKICKYFEKLRILMPNGTEGDDQLEQSFDTTQNEEVDEKMSSWSHFEEEDESLYSPEVIIHQRDDDEVDLNLTFTAPETSNSVDKKLEGLETNYLESLEKPIKKLKTNVVPIPTEKSEAVLKNTGGKDTIILKQLELESRRLTMEERKLGLEERRLTLEEKRLNLELSKIQYEQSSFKDELSIQREKLAIQKENEIRKFELQLDATLKLEMAKLELAAYKKCNNGQFTNDEPEPPAWDDLSSDGQNLIIDTADHTSVTQEIDGSFELNGDEESHDTGNGETF